MKDFIPQVEYHMFNIPYLIVSEGLVINSFLDNERL